MNCYQIKLNNILRMQSFVNFKEHFVNENLCDLFFIVLQKFSSKMAISMSTDLRTVARLLAILI